jgi:hypothetical protein
MSERIIAEGIEAHLGERLLSVRPLGGGCIGEVYRAELADGTTLVAKVDRDGESHLEREAYMLRYLRERTDLPVPEVFHGSETLLLMEFVEGSSRFSEGAEHHAAELLSGLQTSRRMPTATSETRLSEAWISRTRGRKVGPNSSGTTACCTWRTSRTKRAVYQWRTFTGWNGWRSGWTR